MEKLLIIEDNIIQSKQIINYVSSHISNLKLYNISCTGKEAIEIIKKDLVDIIILDLGLPDFSGIEILDYIKENNLKKYQNSIIIVSGNTLLFNELPKYNFIYKTFFKPVDLNELSRSIKSVCINQNNKIKERIIIEKIKKELDVLNYNFLHNGTQYLLEVILELYIVRNDFNSNKEENLKKYVYPLIAKRHNKKVDTIYGNIKQATNQMYKKCDKDFIIKYFNFRFVL